MKIVVADQMESEVLAALNEFGRVNYFGDLTFSEEKRARIKKALGEGAEALVVRSETIVDVDLIANAPNLKIIARSGVGLDNIKAREECRTRGIEVLNTPDAHAINVAEHALYLIFRAAKENKNVPERTKAGEWPKKEANPMELAGLTLGLVGFGRIGRRLGHLAKGLGMQVVFFDPDSTIESRFPKTMKYALRVSTLEELLRVSDVVSLHAPENEHTIGMINAAAIAQMKDGAILINTGRGKLIVEADLAAALQSGKLRGAGLDVFCNEPYRGGALSNAPNVVTTPHIASATKPAQLRCGNEIVGLLRERAGIERKFERHFNGRNGMPGRLSTGNGRRRITTG